MRRVSIGLFILLILALAEAADAQVIYVATNSVGVAWDAVTTDTNGNQVIAHHYEVRLIRDLTFDEYNYGTADTLISIPRPRSGVYEVKVRAVKQAQDGSMAPGAWCSSINASCALLTADAKARPPVLVEGPGDWKVYFKVAAPIGPVIINKSK